MVKEVFDKHGGKKLSDPRHPDVVAERIARTVLEPGYAYAYRSNSCYNHVARAIRRGVVHDDDHIVLLGIEGAQTSGEQAGQKKAQVLHAAVMRDATPLHDSVAQNAQAQVDYDAGTGTYRVAGDEREVTYRRIREMRFADFKAKYNHETLDVEAERSYPPYQGDGGKDDRRPMHTPRSP